MWWSAFLEVLQDLWKFSTGYSPVVQQSASKHPSKPVYTNQTAEVQQPLFSNVQLENGVRYTANHDVTIAIRERLSVYDTHLVKQNDLTAKEWLLYIVHNKRASVPLLSLQMTPTGRWYNTLKGQSDVVIGVIPYTGALMEWVTEQGDDCVAVIQEVTPAETITIGQLGLDTPGLYTTKILTRQQWLELRPVFTAVQ